MPATHRNDYAWVLLGLLLFLLASPIAEQYFPGLTSFIVNVSLMLPIVVSVLALKRGARLYRWGIAAAALLVVLQAADVGALDREIAPVIHLLMFLFLVGIATIALQDVLFGGPIDLNRIVGAVCVYILYGIAWGLLYAMLDTATFEPAFSNIDAYEPGGDVSAYVYYSFVTLTTLGYGDIAPITPVSRVLAVLEAICGQFYLTILVAALVGVLLSRLPTGGRDG